MRGTVISRYRSMDDRSMPRQAPAVWAYPGADIPRLWSRRAMVSVDVSTPGCGMTLAQDSVRCSGAALANVGGADRACGVAVEQPDRNTTTPKTSVKITICGMRAMLASASPWLRPGVRERSVRSRALRSLPTRPGGLEPPTYGFGYPVASATDRTISSPAGRLHLRVPGWGAGRFPHWHWPMRVRGYRRGGSPAGLYTFRRPSLEGSRHAPPAARLGIARHCLSGWGFPEFTRFASARFRAGPLFDEGNRCSVLLSYERSVLVFRRQCTPGLEPSRTRVWVDASGQGRRGPG